MIQEPTFHTLFFSLSLFLFLRDSVHVCVLGERKVSSCTLEHKTVVRRFHNQELNNDFIRKQILTESLGFFVRIYASMQRVKMQRHWRI